MAHLTSIPPLLAPHIARWALDRRREWAGGAPIGLALPGRSHARSREEFVQRADPLSIGIAIITAVEASTGLLIGFEIAATVGTLAIGVAISGANYALQKLTAPKALGASDAGTINAPEIRGNIRQASPPARVIYGAPDRCGGAVYLLDDSAPPYLRLGLLLSDRPVSGLDAVHIGANRLSFASAGANAIITPVAIEGQNYIKAGVSRLRVCWRAGSPAQSISALWAACFPSLETSFRQRGIATIDFEFTYGDDVDDFEKTWGQVSIPSPFAGVRGAPLYDPTDPSQFYPTDWRDADAVAAAMATWTYSNVAARVQADWLGWPEGMRARPDRIRWDEVARAAEYDAGAVYDRDGNTWPRHTIDGVVTYDQGPSSVMEVMLTASRGFVVTSRGRGWVASSQPRTPVLTITDDMVMGAFEFRGLDRPNSDSVNRITSRFPSDTRDYQEVDGPTLARPDLEELHGERLPRALRFPFTKRHQAVQRLEWEYMENAQLARAWSGPLKLPRGVFRLDIGDCVRWESKQIPEMNGLYTVDDAGFFDDFRGLQVSLNEYDPDIPGRYDALIDERPFTLPALTVS